MNYMYMWSHINITVAMYMHMRYARVDNIHINDIYKY